jgi:hypothetical protein
LKNICHLCTFYNNKLFIFSIFILCNTSHLIFKVIIIEYFTKNHIVSLFFKYQVHNLVGSFLLYKKFHPIIH